jgi:hypothetical protein
VEKIQYYEIPEFPPLIAKNIEGLPPIPLNSTDWRAWEQEVLLHRINTKMRTTEHWSGQQRARAEEILRTKKDGRYWLSVYGSIYQARPDEDMVETDDWYTEDEGKPNGWVIPFIPYLFQLYVWDFQIKAFRTKGVKGDTAYVKSRQMGLTNLLTGVFSHAWMVKRPFQGRLMSRKEDLVDEANNPDSMFWKIRLQLQSQPKWLLHAFAPGFDWRKSAGWNLDAALTNPANMNHLAGESTNVTAGRGGAATAALLDEFAFMKGGGGIWTALRAATRHRIAPSTVNLSMGTHFYDLFHRPENESPARLRIPHYLHPDHDEKWVEQERARDTVAGFETEVMMNWFGDVSEFVYPDAAKIEFGDNPYQPYAGPVFIDIDDGYRNWAFWVIQYIEATGKHNVIDAYWNEHKPVDFYGSIFRHTYIDGFDYDVDEHQIMSLMRVIQQPIYVMDTHGKHIEQVAGMSVIDRLSSRWGIFANVDYEKRDYKDRWEYTARGIPNMTLNDNLRTRKAWEAVRHYRWKKREESSEILSEDRSPVKNKFSHYATALEYHWTNWEQFKNIYIPGGKIYYEAV